MTEPKKETYSVAMIVRNCASDLEKTLENYAKYPDEVVVVNTGLNKTEAGFNETNAVAEKYGAKIFHFPWIEDFSAARNFSFARCTHPFVMWLDSDDTVENPKRTDANIRMAINSGADLVFMEYLYEFDRFGNCTTIQDRERVVRKDSFWWPDVAPVHEVLCATQQYVTTYMPPNAGRIIHNRKAEEFERSRSGLRRNLKILRHHYIALGKAPEKRMVYYWANTLHGLGDHQGAIEKYREYLKRSKIEGNGHDAEIISAYIGLSESLMILDRIDESEEEIGKAVLLNPAIPTPYLILARLALFKNDHAKAISMANQVLKFEENMKQQLVSNPRELIGRTHYILAMSAAAMGRMDVAKIEIGQAEKFFKGDPQFATFSAQVADTIKRDELLKSWNMVRDHLLAEGRKDELAGFSNYAPTPIAEEMHVQGFTPKYRPKDKKSIAIVCVSPGGHVPWGPWSIKEGVGGSEEAVVNVSREFAKRGWHVEVYAHTGKPVKSGPWKDEHGVLWYRTATWAGNFDNPVDVAISWRAPGLFKATGVNATLKYLWLHDIRINDAWHRGATTEYDGYLLLSKFHRGLFKDIPEDRVIYTANGLDPELFVPLEDLTNEPHRMVWGSDPIRGLQLLLPWWDTIRKDVPDAELDIFYGWTPHFETVRIQDPGSNAVFHQIEALRKKPGINWHGKVGQDELARAYARSGVWPYMTNFPEIHCITALKVQAHGVMPVTVDDFALSETVQYGEKFKGTMSDPANQAAYVSRLIAAMKNPWPREKRLEMARWARTKTWASVVAAWEERFLGALEHDRLSNAETNAGSDRATNRG